MKIKYILSFVMIFLFIQCKTNQLNQLKKEIEKSYAAKFNRLALDKSRELLYKYLSEEILINDTIILMEYFTSSNLNYNFTLYESKGGSIKSYVANKRIEGGKLYIDSLRVSNVPDKILKMVRMGKLDEVKRRGDTSTLTPAATLIINVGVKNEEKNKFDFTTIVTQDFQIYDY